MPPGADPIGRAAPAEGGMRRERPDLAVRRLILVHGSEQDGVSTAGVSQMDRSDVSSERSTCAVKMSSLSRVPILNKKESLFWQSR